MCWSGNAQRRRSEAYYKDILPAARKLIAQGRDKYGNLKIQSQLDQGKPLHYGKNIQVAIGHLSSIFRQRARMACI